MGAVDSTGQGGVARGGMLRGTCRAAAVVFRAWAVCPPGRRKLAGPGRVEGKDDEGFASPLVLGPHSGLAPSKKVSSSSSLWGMESSIDVPEGEQQLHDFLLACNRTRVPRNRAGGRGHTRCVTAARPPS